MKKDCVPEPKIKKKSVKTFHPSCDMQKRDKAISYGYNDRYSDVIGYGQELVLERHKPVSYDTNKTRRVMVKPTEKGTYK
jgi:hypothetical protein